jgi:thiamine biosynthesis protein ThiI
MQSVIIVHHHEITLKRGNRSMFEKQLMKNVRLAMSGIIPLPAVRGGYGRFVIDAGGTEIDVLTTRLARVFGLANICPALKVNQDISEFCTAADQLLIDREFDTIRVETRRADKNFPVNSMEVSAQVGEHLCRKYGVRADMKRPDVTVHIEIVDKKAYVYTSKIPGAGGLPVGVAGKVVALLSAGFDSPVASYHMMKRGAEVAFVHFHSNPYVTRDSVDQVRQLVEILTTYQYSSTVHIVPFGEAQQEIVSQTPSALRVVLYRRFMIRIAEAVARREKAEALVTGESLGQVASQTLRNIAVIDAAANLPVLRPLIGSDKEEIIAVSRKIGTFEISSQPYDDCCSFLTPRNPETWADPEEVEEVEARLDASRLVLECAGRTSVERFSFRKEERHAETQKADP